MEYLNLEQIKKLESLGFKCEHPDEEDPQVCMCVLNLPDTRMLKGVYVCTDGVTVDIYCQEQTLDGTGPEFVINQFPFTEKDVVEAVDYLRAL